MTQFEKIKNMTIEEMTEAVLCIICADVCLNSAAPSCGDCMFSEMCDIKPEDDVRKWLESEVET